MKIALVHMRHKGTGGTERYLNQTARHLALQGHRVTIVCRSHEEAPAPEVEFVVLRSFAPGGGMRMWRFATDAARHLESADYDVVYGLGRTWQQDILRLGGGLVATQLEQARIARHGLRDSVRAAASIKWRLARRVEERAFGQRPQPLIVANSELVRRDVLTRYGLDPETVRVLHNACDCERFHPQTHAAAGAALRAEFGFTTGHHVYLFLGTGYRRKGLVVLLEAFATHAKSAPEARLAVVGYDSELERYRALADSHGIGQKVHFAGGRRDPEICFAAADVYVLPTYYDPFANSTVEALAAGLPVITTTTNGGSERIIQGLSGSVIPNGSPGALAAALAEWGDPERAKIGGHEARRAALEHDEAAATARTEALIIEAHERRS